MALTFTPNNNPAKRAASSYGVITASKTRRRAKDPLIRPGSTPK